jgi:chemotaxis protein MotB
MPKTKAKTRIEEGAPGAPEWMVTFSDCMTLLLTFFVLLLSFSSFDDKIYRKFEKDFGNSFPYLNAANRKDKDAFKDTERIIYSEEPFKGSERPTLEQGPKNSLLSETFVSRLQRKVYLGFSSRFFWGQGDTLSTGGRRTLADLASLLTYVPNSRVVISESPDLLDSTGDELGVSRSWAVMNYLSSCGVKKDRISISASSLMNEQNVRTSELAALPGAGRILEITLLEQNLYR